MKTNILRAFINLNNIDNFNLKGLYTGQNRMNNTGVALEYFVKDVFCGSLQTSPISKKDKIHSNFFSYLGNQNNPPDFIIADGDAIEVKKLENNMRGYIALNSSYPKSKLHNDDPRILKSCKNCDGGNWKQKDMIYCVGSVQKGLLKALWFVYGDCYAADREVYTRIYDSISKRIHEAEDIDFTKTAELAGVKNVDPLGITYLRVRGMWGIKTPHEVFGELTNYENGKNFSAYALMNYDKYNSFPKEDIAAVGKMVKDVEIKSPNNPAKYVKAKLISFTK